MSGPESAARSLRSRLHEIADLARRELDEAHGVREAALVAARAALQLSSRSIRAAHRGEFARARALWKQAGETIRPAAQRVREARDYFDAALTHDAQKEYAEAGLVLALLTGERLPSPDDLGIGPAPYLRGLAEAASELRRAALDALRRGETTRAVELLGHMDDIYTVLVAIDFPEGLTHGLRRTTDQLRGVLERTRGDVTLATRQMSLEERLSALENRLPDV